MLYTLICSVCTDSAGVTGWFKWKHRTGSRYIISDIHFAEVGKHLIYMRIIPADNLKHSPRSSLHRFPGALPPPFKSWIIAPRVCWDEEPLICSTFQTLVSASSFVASVHAAVTERRRVVLMGGINKLVKLPISNHRRASRSRPGPAQPGPARRYPRSISDHMSQALHPASKSARSCY